APPAFPRAPPRRGGHFAFAPHLSSGSLMAVNLSSPDSRVVACRCARPMGSTAQDGREAAPEARSPAARGIGTSLAPELGSPPSCPGCFGRLTPLTSTVASCALACL